MITTRIEPPLLTGLFDTGVTVDTKANGDISNDSKYFRTKTDLYKNGLVK